MIVPQVLSGKKVAFLLLWKRLTIHTFVSGYSITKLISFPLNPTQVL